MRRKEGKEKEEEEKKAGTYIQSYNPHLADGEQKYEK